MSDPRHAVSVFPLVYQVIHLFLWFHTTFDSTVRMVLYISFVVILILPSYKSRGTLYVYYTMYKWHFIILGLRIEFIRTFANCFFFYPKQICTNLSLLDYIPSLYWVHRTIFQYVLLYPSIISICRITLGFVLFSV